MEWFLPPSHWKERGAVPRHLRHPAKRFAVENSIPRHALACLIARPDWMNPQKLLAGNPGAELIQPAEPASSLDIRCASSRFQKLQKSKRKKKNPGITPCRKQESFLRQLLTFWWKINLCLRSQFLNWITSIWWCIWWLSKQKVQAVILSKT